MTDGKRPIYLDIEEALRAASLAADDPWKAKSKDLARGAAALLGKPGTSTYFDKDGLGQVLLTVLQARALSRATWALVAATCVLAAVTAVLVWATLQEPGVVVNITTPG